MGFWNVKGSLCGDGGLWVYGAGVNGCKMGLYAAKAVHAGD